MKVFWLILLVALLPFGSHEQTSITHSAGYGEEVPGPACLACAGTDWNYLENISVADDSVTTTGLNPYGNCFMSTCYYSRFLYAHHFNFMIPVDATIDSVFVDIRRAANVENSIRDTIVQLVVSGSPTGSNLGASILWPTSLHNESYGLKDPLWGITLHPADLNDSTSGVTLKVENISSKEAEAEIDHIQMTVYYSIGTGIYSVTSSSSLIEWRCSAGEISANIFTPQPVHCSSVIYNLNGEEIISFNYGRSLTGQNHFEYSDEKLTNGIYIWKIIIGRNIYTKKFVIMN